MVERLLAKEEVASPNLVSCSHLSPCHCAAIGLPAIGSITDSGSKRRIVMYRSTPFHIPSIHPSLASALRGDLLIDR